MAGHEAAGALRMWPAALLACPQGLSTRVLAGAVQGGHMGPGLGEPPGAG